MAKKVKSVGFNSNNPEEAAMLKAIRRRNFSGYVKKLIAADLRAREVAQAEPPAPPVESSQYESPEAPYESPEIPPHYNQPRKKPAHYTQATPSHYPQHPQQPPQQYYPPTQDPRNRPLINPKPRGY